MVYFGLYEIAPYSSGMPVFAIPYEVDPAFVILPGERGILDQEHICVGRQDSIATVGRSRSQKCEIE